MNRHLQKEELEAIGKMEPYYRVKHHIAMVKEQQPCPHTNYQTAGRVMSIRDFGSTVFMVLRCGLDELQVMLKKDFFTVTTSFQECKNLVSIGDIVGFTGVLTVTKTQALALQAKDFTVLVKNMRDLPLKNQLKDKETCYRQRYLDLLVNKDTYLRFVLRSKLIHLLRKFLHQKDFLELETPVLNSLPCGASASSFETYHKDLNLNLHLRIATEIHLKTTIVAGMPKVFEIGRIFRNEGISPQHNPEFTSVEWYEAYSNYEDGMNLVEELISYLNVHFKPENTLLYQKPKKITMFQAIIDHFQVNKQDVSSITWLQQKLREHNITCTQSSNLGLLQYDLFDKIVAPKLQGMVFVIHYPAVSSPLAMPNYHDNHLADRAELFFNGMEICNLYSELTDPKQQRDNMIFQDEKSVVEDYIEAMDHGLPPCCGVGIGLDRLTMLYTQAKNIRDVILFPLLKDKNSV